MVIFKHALTANRISFCLQSGTDFRARFVPLPIAIFPLSNQFFDCSQLT